MNIAEKLIVNGNIGAQVKNDLGYVLFDYKANNPNKNITHARKLIEKTLENDYGYNLDEIEIELSESINYIKLEVNKKVGIHER